MRLILSDILRQNDNIQLVDTAANGLEAIEKVKQHQPDVVLCDLVMPEYDGRYVVQQLMREQPLPVILLSSLDRNHQMAFDALEEGAFSFIEKPRDKAISNIRNLSEYISSKIEEAATINPARLRPQPILPVSHAHTWQQDQRYQIIVIAASTGGPRAIETILNKFPSNLPVPIVIIQHMPANFLESFASRLQNQLPHLRIRIARDQEPLEPCVYIAPGDANLKLVKQRQYSRITFSTTMELYDAFNNPSADCFLLSAARIFKDKALAVVLTGMGKDGTKGLLAIRDQGGFTIAQDEASAIVYGMPGHALSQGAIRQVVPLKEIAPYLVGCLELE